MRLSEFVVKSPCFALPYYFCHSLRMASKWGKIKDNRMFMRYSIRRARVADLDRIMEIERASFGRDAYDRNLFAEYTRKCGELFLVAERSQDVSTPDPSTFGKAWGYALTCLFARRCGGVSRKQAELISVAVQPLARGTGAARKLS